MELGFYCWIYSIVDIIYVCCKCIRHSTCATIIVSKQCKRHAASWEGHFSTAFFSEVTVGGLVRVGRRMSKSIGGGSPLDIQDVFFFRSPWWW